jgi:hypothetical protein
MLYFGTGNVDHTSCTQPMPLEDALVELKAANLSMVAFWPLPKTQRGQDTDYGSNPTLFQATINAVSHALVGIVNKNGYYYALDRNTISAGPRWQVRLSPGGADATKTASIAGGVFDGSSLYVAGSSTTIGTQQCAGSLRALDPSTGTTRWAKCLSGPVLAPVLGVPGLVVVNGGNTMSVVDSKTGKILFSYQDRLVNGNFWGAAMIWNGVLYNGSRSGTLFAFGL